MSKQLTKEERQDFLKQSFFWSNNLNLIIASLIILVALITFLSADPSALVIGKAIGPVINTLGQFGGLPLILIFILLPNLASIAVVVLFIKNHSEWATKKKWGQLLVSGLIILAAFLIDIAILQIFVAFARSS